ncbi:MAG: hypothetical protein WC980_00240 [Candidatus Brocadiia bacterium]
MKPFIITFDGDIPHNGRDLVKFCRFLVKQGELSFPVNVALTLEATCNFKINLGSENENKALIEEVFFKIALQRLKEKLASGNYPQKSTLTCEEIMISSTSTPEDISPFLNKACHYQQQEIKGPICGISRSLGNPSDNITNVSFCKGCSMPDKSLICSCLIHPASQCYRNLDKKITERNIIEVYCNKGESLDGIGIMLCIPQGGQECWEQIYEIPQLAINIPTDLSERVVDEIDFLNLYVKNNLNKDVKLIDLKFYRPISDVRGKCQTAEEFAALIQTLGTILDRGQFKIIELLPEDKRTKKEGNKDMELNSMEALERFLQLNYSSSGETLVKTLRHIIQVRNSYPTHQKEAIGAFEALDIEHPIVNHQKAWDKILWAFYDSIKILRKLIQNN